MFATGLLRRIGAKVFRKRLAARLLLAALGLLVGCLLCELCACLYLRLNPPAEYLGRWEFRSSCPPPYQHADYYGPEFLSESMRSVRLEVQPDTQLIVPGDFAGRFIHVERGRRRTTDQPETFDRRVLLFGASTIFNSEVPDEWTVASCLQRLLNQKSGTSWRVENFGTSSMIAAQHADRLMHCDVRPGDVVIFYCGVNDVFYPIYNGNPEGWRPGASHDGGVRQLSSWQRRLYPLALKYQDRSATARLLFRRLDNPAPRNVVNPKVLEQHLRDAETGYREALQRAHALAFEKKASFIHFLQPNIFTLAKPSTYEERIAANELKALPGLDRAFELGYPRLRAAAAEAANDGFASFDLSGLFDGDRAGKEYYLDFCHVTHIANQRIAEAIYERAFAGTQ